MNKIMRARIFCWDVLEAVAACPGQGVVVAELLGEVSKDGKKFRQYKNLPEWKCPVCGAVQKFSYAEIGDAAENEAQAGVIEFLEVPITYTSTREREFYWLPEHLRELVR